MTRRGHLGLKTRNPHVPKEWKCDRLRVPLETLCSRDLRQAGAALGLWPLHLLNKGDGLEKVQSLIFPRAYFRSMSIHFSKAGATSGSIGGGVDTGSLPTTGQGGALVSSVGSPLPHGDLGKQVWLFLTCRCTQEMQLGRSVTCPGPRGEYVQGWDSHPDVEIHWQCSAVLESWALEPAILGSNFSSVPWMLCDLGQVG